MGDGAVGGVALGDGVLLLVVAGDGVVLCFVPSFASTRPERATTWRKGGSKDRCAFNTLSNGESFKLQGGLGETLAAMLVEHKARAVLDEVTFQRLPVVVEFGRLSLKRQVLFIDLHPT
eukprot:CAMPEP_0182584862 /NCGR_PEP_ID=MMETSP1324-20130603/58894_1 /TAXON_ID=236786 /ORGANISM="Florenciella sp., Strain RCC1587" /LENGTH=118 /DNA_ID=CAMNT_0024801611 /DNA_START=373 /DNA_END=725 /DNA_ORIENTATION=-